MPRYRHWQPISKLWLSEVTVVEFQEPASTTVCHRGKASKPHKYIPELTVLKPSPDDRLATVQRGNF